MKSIIGKLLEVEREISHERGPFTLFAAIEREDSQGFLDLVVSALWFVPSPRDTLREITSSLARHLAPEEITTISRIVALEPTDAFVQRLNELVEDQTDVTELLDCVVNGISIKHAYILRSSGSDARLIKGKAAAG